MPIDSGIVGREIQDYVETLSVRRLLAYAAGISAREEIYLDDLRHGGVIGFPAFAVSLEWNARAMPDQIGLTQSESIRGVHATQDSYFHRPLRPGMKLRTVAVITGVYQTRAGVLLVNRYETRDADSGEPMVTSWVSSMLRGMRQEGLPLESEPAPETPKLDLDLERCTRVAIEIPREMPHAYTECASIWNPIHTEREVALGAGLPDIILHGTATWALAGREVIRNRLDGDPTRLRRLHGRFTGMVIPGTSIEVRIGEPQAGQVAFDVLNADGEAAISSGLAELG